MVDLLLAEVLVGLLLAGGQLRSAELRDRGISRELQPAAIEVVTGRDLPLDAHAVRAVGQRGDAERDVGWQELIVARGLHAGRARRRQRVGGGRGRRGVTLAEHRGDAGAAVAALLGRRQQFGRRRAGDPVVRRGHAVDAGRAATGARGALRVAHLGVPLGRRIAEARVRAALQLQRQRQHRRRRRAAGDLHRHRDLELPAIHLLRAEVLVGVRLALGKSRFAERGPGRARLEAETLAVEVVALGDGPAHRDHAVAHLDAVAERLLGRDEVLGARARRKRREHGGERQRQRRHDRAESTGHRHNAPQRSAAASGRPDAGAPASPELPRVTQSRYPVEPATTGRAMISGTS